MPVLDRDSVAAATCKASSGSESAVSECSRRKAGTCVPPQGKVRAHYSNL